jgi:hypothetical protein
MKKQSLYFEARSTFFLIDDLAYTVPWVNNRLKKLRQRNSQRREEIGRKK